MTINKNYTDNRDSTNKYVPKTPVEKILAKMNGDDIDVPYPNKPLEYQLKRLADSSTPVSKADADILKSAAIYNGIGWVEDERLIFEGELLPSESVEIHPATFPLLDIGSTVTLYFKIDSEENYSPFESRPIENKASGVNRCIFEGLANNDIDMYLTYQISTDTNAISFRTLEHAEEPRTFSIIAFDIEHKIDERFLPETPEIPEPTSEDSGKILGVNQQGEYYIRNENPNELPTPTAQDEGKIVYVDGSGNYILDDLPSGTWTAGLTTYTASTRAIAVGTAEFEDGVTDLPTGVIYLQIEE